MTRTRAMGLFAAFVVIAMALFVLLRPRAVVRESLEERPSASTISIAPSVDGTTSASSRDLGADDGSSRVGERSPAVLSSTLVRPSQDATPSMRAYGSVGLYQYSMPFDSSSDVHSRIFTQFVGEGAIQVGDRLRFGAAAEAKKLYEIAAVGEDEWIVADPVGFVEYDTTVDPKQIASTISVTSSIPLSKHSQQTHRLTRTTTAVNLAHEFGRSHIRIEWTPAASYQFNRYATQDSNRDPLDRLEVASTVEVSYGVNDSVRLAVWGRPKRTYFEQYDDRDVAPASSTGVDYGAFVNFDLFARARVEVGYARGASALRSLRFSEYFYDPSSSRAYAGVSIAL